MDEGNWEGALALFYFFWEEEGVYIGFEVTHKYSVRLVKVLIL